MALPHYQSKVTGTVCNNCLRHLRQPICEAPKLSFVQSRAKSKNVKPKGSVPVKLLQDVQYYGRKGSIVPVPLGKMRNFLFPNHVADYLPADQIRQMRRDGVPVERDAAFGRRYTKSTDSEEEKLDVDERTPRVDLRRLPPDGAFNLLSDVVPPTIDFYRRPISTRDERTAPSASLSPEDEVDTIAPRPEQSPRQTPENIFGSVTTNDINSEIKALLQKRGFAGLITLPDEDVRFVNLAGTDSEADRIKKLGTYQYEIRVKGHEEVINRFIRILAENSEVSANQETPTAG